MKMRYLIYFVVISFAIASCNKNNLSNIPQISLIYFGTSTSTDSFILNIDTPFLRFNIQDGNGNLGNDPTGSQRDIYIHDYRFDTFAGYFFPPFDQSIENPKNGITGTCTFIFLPAILTARTDSIHQKYGDTTHFALYIVDKAGHHSDTIYTKPIIMRP